jgi:hypothetical protein
LTGPQVDETGHANNWVSGELSRPRLDRQPRHGHGRQRRGEVNPRVTSHGGKWGRLGRATYAQRSRLTYTRDSVNNGARAADSQPAAEQETGHGTTPRSWHRPCRTRDVGEKKEKRAAHTGPTTETRLRARILKHVKTTIPARFWLNHLDYSLEGTKSCLRKPKHD